MKFTWFDALALVFVISGLACLTSSFLGLRMLGWLAIGAFGGCCRIAGHLNAIAEQEEKE